MKIVICGSMFFSKEMIKIADKLKKNNHEVILPRNAKEYANKKLNKEKSSESIRNKIEDDLIRDYFNEIKNADAVLILNFDKNEIKNYIGGNSFLEMGFAHALNKKIFLLNDIPILRYSDEILAIQPIIINSDLLMIK